jgi:Flp pilus assembly pilin Flp
VGIYSILYNMACLLSMVYSLWEGSLLGKVLKEYGTDIRDSVQILMWLLHLTITTFIAVYMVTTYPSFMEDNTWVFSHISSALSLIILLIIETAYIVFLKMRLQSKRTNSQFAQ